MFRAAYFIVFIIGIAPTIPGLAGAILSSFSYIPPIGLAQFSWQGYHLLWEWNGVGQAIALTLFSAITSTYIALLFCFSILQRLWQSRYWKKIEACLSPLLAMPHVAFAIGFAFLFSPTGMLARSIQTVFDTGINTQGATWLIHDPYALGLTLALALKEVPFLLLMSIPILQQLQVSRLQQVSHSLGYSTAQMWWKVILPQWLSKMRFALFAVIAYGCSVVDVALILGPNNPATFAVLVWQWFNDPDLSLLPRAAAGAMVLFIIATLLLLLVITIEKAATKVWTQWHYSGRSGVKLPGKSIFNILLLIATLMVPMMIVWSFAHRWRFPDLLPSRWSLRFWEIEWINIIPTINESLVLALTTATIALLLALIAHEYKLKHQLRIPDYVIALPMLIPQLSILFGLQVTTLYLAADAYHVWVIWAHVFFAFPYVYLALDGPWKSYNDNFSKAALSLGKAPLTVFIQIKARLLLPAILYAWAIGASVSLAQYLPTLMLGGGRIATITTEAVALSSGFDRRVTAIYAIWQAALPFIFFTFAVLSSRLTQRKFTFINKEIVTNDTLSQRPRHL